MEAVCSVLFFCSTQAYYCANLTTLHHFTSAQSAGGPTKLEPIATKVLQTNSDPSWTVQHFQL